MRSPLSWSAPPMLRRRSAGWRAPSSAQRRHARRPPLTYWPHASATWTRAYAWRPPPVSPCATTRAATTCWRPWPARTRARRTTGSCTTCTGIATEAADRHHPRHGSLLLPAHAEGVELLASFWGEFAGPAATRSASNTTMHVVLLQQRDHDLVPPRTVVFLPSLQHHRAQVLIVWQPDRHPRPDSIAVICAGHHTTLPGAHPRSAGCSSAVACPQAW